MCHQKGMDVSSSSHALLRRLRRLPLLLLHLRRIVNRRRSWPFFARLRLPAVGQRNALLRPQDLVDPPGAEPEMAQLAGHAADHHHERQAQDPLADGDEQEEFVLLKCGDVADTYVVCGRNVTGIAAIIRKKVSPVGTLTRRLSIVNYLRQVLNLLTSLKLDP